jgi:hypothetical protein
MSKKNYLKNVKDLNLSILQIDALSYDEKIEYNNCCLLNALVYIIQKNGSQFIKSNDTDDSIILYKFLEDKNIKLFPLGSLQEDSLIDNVSEIFNLRIGLYDIEKNVFTIHAKCNKKNDYLQYILVYEKYHFNIGIIYNEDTLENKMKILKKNKVIIIENENYDEKFKNLI